jgi:hypothetical protein
MDRPQEEIDWHFERFTELIQDMLYRDDNLSYGGYGGSVVSVHKGRVYWKIMVDTHDEWGSTRSKIFGFVRRKDGAIFRAATLKAPETRTKTAIRGYVYDDHPEEYFTKYGIIYAEGA